MNFSRMLPVAAGLAGIAGAIVLTVELLRLAARPPECTLRASAARQHMSSAGAGVPANRRQEISSGAVQSSHSVSSIPGPNSPRIHFTGTDALSSRRSETSNAGVPPVTSSTAPAGPAGWSWRPAVASPVVPVAFQDPPPGAVALEGKEWAAVQAVQDLFIEESGSGTSDPATPEYRKRWPQSQSVADQRLRAAIGGQAFARWQMEAYLRAKQESGGSGP